MGGTLGAKTDVKIPVVSVSKADGARLAGRAGPPPRSSSTPVVRDERTRNVIAQTKTGSTAERGDGRRAPRQRARGSWHQRQRVRCGGRAGNRTADGAVRRRCSNAVRFGFWGAEELGLRGLQQVRRVAERGCSSKTLRCISISTCSPRRTPGTSPTTVTSPRRPTANEGAPRVPEGSAGIERTLVAYLKGAGKTARGHVIRRPVGL